MQEQSPGSLSRSWSKPHSHYGKSITGSTTHCTREDAQGRMLWGPPMRLQAGHWEESVVSHFSLLFCFCFFITRVHACHQLQTLPINYRMWTCPNILYATLSPQLLKTTKWFLTSESGQVLVATKTTTFTQTLRSNGASTLDNTSLQRKHCSCERGSPGFFPLSLQTNLSAGQKTEVWDAKVEC